MTEDPDHRRAMQAAGAAPFVGHVADSLRAERARTLEAPDRHGPLRTGRFTVELDGVQVDGVERVDLPRRYSPAGDGEQGPAGAAYGLLELRRELRAGDTKLHDWRTAVEEGRQDAGRKRVVVSLQDETGATAFTWRFSGGWPTTHESPTLATTSGGEGEVATESVTVAFERVERLVDTAPAQAQEHGDDSGIFRYVRTANGGRIDDGAAVVTGSDAGIERVTLGRFDRPVTAAGQHVGLLVPAGARGGDDPTALWLLEGADVDEGTPRVVGDGAEGRLYWVPARTFFHDDAWAADGTVASSSEAGPPPERSVPGWPSGDRSGVRVLLDTGEQSLEAALGVRAGSSDADAAGVRPANAGDAVDPAATVFAVVGSATAPFETPALAVSGSGPDGVGGLLDAGSPAPLAGATFGLGTFSTPDASVAGQSVNPLVGMETVGLLEHEVARRMLARAGLTDVDTVEWRDGPRSAGADATRSTELLGTRTDVESYQGVVSGRDGPWAVGVHVGRITDDAHVVVAGVHRQPLGTASRLADTSGWERVLARARAFTSATAERLEYL